MLLVYPISHLNVFLQPPQGYDSVVGEPGLALNYDESIGESFRYDMDKIQLLIICTHLVYKVRLRWLFSLSLNLIAKFQDDAIRPAYLVIFGSQNSSENITPRNAKISKWGNVMVKKGKRITRSFAASRSSQSIQSVTRMQHSVYDDSSVV